MQEIRRQLANSNQTPYSKGGDIFMAEPGNGEGLPGNSKGEMPRKLPPGPVPPLKKVPQFPESGVAKPVSAERQAMARKAWEENYGGSLPEEVGERRVIGDLIGRGELPIGGGAPDGEEESGGPIAEGASGRGGGGERPPAPPLGDTPEESGESGDEGVGVFHIDTESLGITNERLLNMIRGLEEGVRYSISDEAAYNSLLEGLRDIHALPSGEDPSGQKSLAVLAVREQLDIVFRNRVASAEKDLSQDERVQMRDKIQDLRETISSTLEDSEKMDKIEGIINSLDPNERAYPHIIAEAIRGIESRETDYLVEDILEYSLERLLNRADSNPLEDYPQFTFTESENIAVITNTARIFDEARKASGIELGIEPGRRGMFKYLTTLNNRRRVMHELFKGMNDLESFTGLVTKALRKSGMSFVETQLAGVTDVQIVYDQVLLSLKSLKPQEKGWLLEEDFDKGDAMVKDIFERSMNEHPDEFYRTFIRNDGTKGSRPLRQWEIDRAFHMGRDLSGASQRRVVYGILGDVPGNVDEFLKSVAHEPIARRLAPLKLIPERFFGHGIAKRFLSIFKTEQKRRTDGTIDHNKYGYVIRDKDGNIQKGPDGELLTRGLFGSSQGDFAILDLGIVDPKSNSWRSRLLYLKNPRFMKENIDGRSTTLGDYLDRTKTEFIRGKETRRDKEHAIEEWNNAIRGRISDQRLFLGVLLRYPDLDVANKTAIWKNISNNLPSRIASLLPNETLEVVDNQFGLGGNREQAIERWENIVKKMWIAERMRVGNDARVLSGDDGELHDSDYYFSRVDLTDEEIVLVGKIRDKGREFAPILSNVKFPFTAFLDDAPETDWERTSDFDFTRILVSDQNAFQEGFGHIMGLLENPVMKPEDVSKALIEAFNKIKGPPGIPDAQKIFEPIVKATIKMRRMKGYAKWMGTTLARALRIPTSPIEEYNLQAHIADDENDVVGMLHTLGQADVLSDNRNDVDEKGRTQYQRYREDLDVDKKEVILAYIRLMIQLFGPAFGLELAKALGLKMQG